MFKLRTWYDSFFLKKSIQLWTWRINCLWKCWIKIYSENLTKIRENLLNISETYQIKYSKIYVDVLSIYFISFGFIKWWIEWIIRFDFVFFKKLFLNCFADFSQKFNRCFLHIVNWNNNILNVRFNKLESSEHPRTRFKTITEMK